MINNMKNNLTTKGWLAVHLHYSEHWEEFLIKAIKPYVDSIVKTGLAEQYAFMRYWDRGPHIRLRFEGNIRLLEQLLKPNLEEHFCNYYEAKPSRLLTPVYPTTIPANYKWIPNNSIQYAIYQSPIARLGMSSDIEHIANSHFQASSTCVLNIINEKYPIWDKEELLSHAIRMHLSLFHKMEWSLARICLFFREYLQKWLSNSLKTIRKSSENQNGQKIMKEFEKEWKREKEVFLPQARKFWQQLQQKKTFSDSGFNQWLEENEKINSNLKKIIHHSKREKFAYLTPLFLEFVHQTNNRLGIHDIREAYISFIIVKLAEEMLIYCPNDFAQKSDNQKVGKLKFLE